MNISMVHPPDLIRRRRVIALHCSGAGGSQWANLAKTLGIHYQVLTPEHSGCNSSGSWSGAHTFALGDEAARTIALIDESEETMPGKVLSYMPAFQPYRGKPAVRNDREGRENVGIIRSPIRASTLPD